MSLWTEIQPWIDKETGLMFAADGGRDNMILMSAYLFRELNHYGSDVGMNALMKSVFRFLDNTRVASGLYSRRPGDKSDNSVDNLIGICYLSMGASVDILNRWRKFWGCYDVNNPNRISFNKNCYLRFIGLKAYIIACAGERPNLFYRLQWCLAVWWTVKTSKGASDKLLMSLQVDIMKHCCPKAAHYFEDHVMLKSLYQDYFGLKHPITVWA